MSSSSPAPRVASGASGKTGQKLRSWRFWGGFAFACVLLVVFDNLETLTQSVLNAGAAYRRLVATGFKPLYPRFTAIVRISDADEPREVTAVNVCQQRLFLSRVLKVIRDAAPTVVTIDKEFSPDSCPEQPEGTIALQRAVGDLLESKVRVVIGVNNDSSYTLRPILDFPVASNATRSRPATVLFDEDVRRAPFGWNDFKDEAGKDVALASLSFASAKAHTPDLEQVDSRLRGFRETNVSPFVVFFPSNGFDSHTFSAVALLCGPDPAAQKLWKTCATPDQTMMEQLRGRIVLVGEVAPGLDQHDTVVGTMSGLWLHANYIEAILGGDLLRPLPAWASYLYGFAVFFVVELVLLIGQRRLVKAGVAVVVIVAAYGVCYLLVTTRGIYLNPGLGLVALVFSQLTDKIRSALIEDGRQAA